MIEFLVGRTALVSKGRRRLEEAPVVEYNSSNGHCTNHTGISGLATRLPVTPKKIRH